MELQTIEGEEGLEALYLYVKGSTWSRAHIRWAWRRQLLRWRVVVCFILTDSTVTGALESKLALGQTEGLFKKVTEKAYIDYFDEFAVRLVTALESQSSKTVRTQREWL